jgi:UDP-glucose 4-epimerase
MYEGYYAGKIILVTGGAGAIGRNLCGRLAELGARKVIILDNLSSSFSWNIPDRPNIMFIKGDIRNEDDLRRAFHHRPAIVFHLAAFFANQNSVDYPLVSEEVNAGGILKLLELSVISGGVEKFVYTNSEGGAYGPGSKLPYSEEDISLRLGSPYYISKMAAESYCYYYQSYYRLPVAVLRLFNSYGPGEVPGQYRNVIPNFIYWALKNQPLPLTGDETISRDFVFVKDTVEGILRAGYFREAVGTPVNIASGQEHPIYEVARLINEITGNPAGIRVLNRRKWDTRPRIIGNNARCLKILGFRPETDFRTGLELTVKWFKENRAAIEKSAEFGPGSLSPLDEANAMTETASRPS